MTFLTAHLSLLQAVFAASHQRWSGRTCQDCYPWAPCISSSPLLWRLPHRIAQCRDSRLSPSQLWGPSTAASVPFHPLLTWLCFQAWGTGFGKRYWYILTKPYSLDGHNSSSLAKHHLVDCPKVSSSYLSTVNQILGTEMMLFHLGKLQLSSGLDLHRQIHSFIHWFVRCFIHWFVRWFIH